MATGGPVLCVWSADDEAEAEAVAAVEAEAAAEEARRPRARLQPDKEAGEAALAQHAADALAERVGGVRALVVGREQAVARVAQHRRAHGGGQRGGDGRELGHQRVVPAAPEQPR